MHDRGNVLVSRAPPQARTADFQPLEHASHLVDLVETDRQALL